MDMLPIVSLGQNDIHFSYAIPATPVLLSYACNRVSVVQIENHSKFFSSLCTKSSQEPKLSTLKSFSPCQIPPHRLLSPPVRIRSAADFPSSMDVNGSI